MTESEKREAEERAAWVRFAAAAAVGISYEPTAGAAAEYADELLAEYRKRWPGGAPPPAAGQTGGRP